MLLNRAVRPTLVLFLLSGKLAEALRAGVKRVGSGGNGGNAAWSSSQRMFLNAVTAPPGVVHIRTMISSRLTSFFASKTEGLAGALS